MPTDIADTSSEGALTVIGMPWKATDAMKERTKFVLEWERRWNEAEGGHINMAELCRMHGITRQTGYKLVNRYKQANHSLEAVAERSRRPNTSPDALPVEVEDAIAAARKKWPKWGPRKLRRKLVEFNPGMRVPAASTIAKVLKRRGLTQPRRRRRRAPAPAGVTAPFSGCDAPNAVWCIDFKGWFLTADGRRCYPLTLLDAFSRFLLRCEALLEPDGKHVRSILDSAFVEYGLPAAIRSDGGPPFASTGPARLTELSVWLLRLGIRVEIIAPGKPQQNGRLERLHRNIEEETTEPPTADCAAQQRRFDPWRHQWNVERPHESLKLRTPASVYTASSTHYPRPLINPIDEDPNPFSYVTRIDKSGHILWHRRRVLISSALRHEYVELDLREQGGGWDVRWGAIHLGHLDDLRRERGLITPSRRRGAKEVSAMSLL
ncbi:MAG TPA: DDE-type integrase/transposase/recombinase [Kofleriaceae bacterium]|nr:DDE-type integrase/transposase/recombinase [Kofleriaceae bacterium]